MNLIRLGNKPPLIVAPDDTVLQAARAITERNVGAATVLDGTTLVGVVTERDVTQKIIAHDRDPKTIRVRDIMSSPVVAVGLLSAGFQTQFVGGGTTGAIAKSVVLSALVLL